MRRKPLVFISSTSDLDEERQAVAASLRPIYDAYLFEEDRARGRSPQEQCRKVIMQSEAFLGILGERYGSSVDEPETSPSICEWEFDAARKRDDIQIMMMLQKVEDASSVDSAQQRFRRRISDFKEGVWCRFFATQQELVQQVQRSLATWLAEYYCQSEETRDRRRRWLRGFAVGMGLGGFLLLVAVVAAHLLGGLLTPTQLIGVCAVSISTILLPLLLLLADSRGTT